MAGGFVLGKGFVDMELGDKGFNNKLGKAGKRLKKFEAGLNKWVKRVAIVGGAAIAGIGAWAIKVAAEQERAEAALTAALEKADEATEKNIRLLHKQAAAIQKVTTIGDEEILMHMATARNMGIEAKELDKVTRAAIGLSRTYNVDVKTALLLITRSFHGQTQMLTRYGIVLDQSMTNEEKFQELLKIGMGGFKLAMAETTTFQGKLKQLQNALGDAGEALGMKLLPSLSDFAEAALKFIEQADFAAWGMGVARALKDAMEAITAWRRFVGEAGEELPGAGGVMFGAATEAEMRTVEARAARTRKRREKGLPDMPADPKGGYALFWGRITPETLRTGPATAEEKGAAQKEREVYLKEANELLKKQIEVQKEMLFGINDLKDLGLYR